MPWLPMAHWRTISPLLADSGLLTLMATGPSGPSSSASEIPVPLADRNAAVGLQLVQRLRRPAARQIGRRAHSTRRLRAIRRLITLPSRTWPIRMSSCSLVHQIDRAVEQSTWISSCGKRRQFGERRASRLRPRNLVPQQIRRSPFRRRLARDRRPSGRHPRRCAAPIDGRSRPGRSAARCASCGGTVFADGCLEQRDALAHHRFWKPPARGRFRQSCGLRATTQNRRRSSS